MDMINQFGWAEVAAIAGAALVCLMTLISVLFGIILKRQGEREGNGNEEGVVAQVKQFQHSIEDKIDSEIENRKEDFALLRRSIEDGRKERRQDISTLHKKLEVGLRGVVEDFRIICVHNQETCISARKAEVKGTKEKLVLTCRTVERIDKDRSRKWEQQEVLNRSFLNKIKVFE